MVMMMIMQKSGSLLFGLAINCLLLTVTVVSGRTSRHGTALHIASKRLSDTAAVGSFTAKSHRNVRAITEPSINKLHIVSRISSRFAQTNIESTILNIGSRDGEATFLVQLPDAAYISNFTMTIAGELYVGVVKEKAKAQEEYEDAKKQNKTAGIVGTAPPPPNRNMQVFSVAINVRANSSAHVVLTYQQLLPRRLGFFELVTSILAKQLVSDFYIRVHVHEPQGIERLHIIEPGQATNSVDALETVITSDGDSDRVIVYSPSLATQQRLNDMTGAVRNYVVRYDVEHGYDAGLLQYDGGHFVHFFSPTGLDPLGKTIVFVIDISGSMAGTKMQQTREAMMAILDQLRTNDRFLLLLFDDHVRFWPSDKIPVPADENMISSAKGFALKTLKATGGTDINNGLTTAASLLRGLEQSAPSMILFLTDGHPTSGVTVRDTIVNNVKEIAGSSMSIFSLGFGQNLDFVLLESLAERTGGFARRIYEGIDASVQLRNFFSEIGTPLLYNVKLSYDDKVVDTTTLTRSAFPQYFNGSELAVAGKLLTNHRQEWVATVTGMSKSEVRLTKNVNSSASPIDTRGILEKLYIHMKIKDLLREKLLTDDKAEQTTLDTYIIRLAIEHNLVTPLTSMIIVQLDNEDVVMSSTDAASTESLNSGQPGRAMANTFSVLVIFAHFIAIIV